MSELVSILIPAYNAEKWIRQTIESALNQTWDNKEIIIVDDGSTDRTLEIAKTYISDLVSVISQKNSGASSARNKAFGLSKGEFIQWLDADDLLAPDKISQQMKVAASRRSNLFLYSSPHGVFYYRYKKAKFTPNALWQDLDPIKWLTINMSENLWMIPAAWLVSRELTDKAGLWDERLSMDDDGEYFTRIVAACEVVKFVREARCYYRQSGFNQLSRNITEQAEKSLILSAKLRIRTLLSLGYTNESKSAALTLLQTRLLAFYPEKAPMLKQLYALASELGGELAKPRLGWQSSLLQRLFGPERGKALIALFRRLRMEKVVKWDEWMSKLGF